MVAISITKEPPVNFPSSKFKEPPFNKIVPSCVPVGFAPFQVITELSTSTLSKAATTATFTASFASTLSFLFSLHDVKRAATTTSDKIIFFIFVVLN